MESWASLGVGMIEPKAEGAAMSENNCELCEGEGPTRLYAKCHIGGPLMVTIEAQELVVRCYVPECRRAVLRIPFQKGCSHE